MRVSSKRFFIVFNGGQDCLLSTGFIAWLSFVDLGTKGSGIPIPLTLNGWKTPQMAGKGRSTFQRKLRVLFKKSG